MDKITTNAVVTRFSAMEHGFHFVNAFDFLPKKKLPKIGKIDLEAMTIIGLCGGMCFSALDLFYSGQQRPAAAQPGELSPKLLEYLKKRQGQSVPVVVFWKLLTWVYSSDQRVAQRTVQEEAPRLKQYLDQGRPAVLLLVRTRAMQNITLNHQVLATGYHLDPQSGKCTVHLYDPNYPGRETTLTFLDKPGPGLELAHSTGEKGRGFFVQAYQKRTPPGF